MVKRIILFCCMALCWCSPVLKAQLVRGYGLKVGVVSAFETFTFSPASFVQSSDFAFSRRTGIGAGMYCEWLDMRVLSIVTQIEYRQGGITDRFYHTGPNGEDLGVMNFHDMVNYVSVSAMAKARMNGAIVRPYVIAGPRFDRILDYSGEFFSLYQEFKKSTYGASFGAGVELAHVAPGTISLELRYDWDAGNSYSSPYYTIRKNSFGVWLGVGF